MLVLVLCQDIDRPTWEEAFRKYDWELLDLATGGGRPDLMWVVDDGARRGPGAMMGTLEDPPPMVVVSDRAEETKEYLYGYGATKVVKAPRSIAGARKLVERMLAELFPRSGKQVDVGRYQPPPNRS